jgi:hypothetical protein
MRRRTGSTGDAMHQMLNSLFALGLLVLSALPASATSITITGTACDSSGCAPFSVTATTDAVSITSASVTPAVAPVGTTRTLTVVAASSAGLALTGSVNAVSGVTFTPVTGQPAGTFAWTFVY